MVILPAILEEMLFRGALLNAFLPYGKIFAIIISALMFSLMHGSLQQTLYQFVIGIVLGVVMYATENILYPIILHFCNNATVILSDFFIASDEVVVYEFNALNIILPIILAIGGILLLLLIGWFLIGLPLGLGTISTL